MINISNNSKYNNNNKIIKIRILVKVTRERERERGAEIKINTWNIRGLKDKEEQFLKADLDGTEVMERETTVWYSGVETDKHASTRVACMIRRKEVESVVTVHLYHTE